MRKVSQRVNESMGQTLNHSVGDAFELLPAALSAKSVQSTDERRSDWIRRLNVFAKRSHALSAPVSGFGL
jgi:hypothetical protein